MIHALTHSTAQIAHSTKSHDTWKDTYLDTCHDSWHYKFHGSFMKHSIWNDKVLKHAMLYTTRLAMWPLRPLLILLSVFLAMHWTLKSTRLTEMLLRLLTGAAAAGSPTGPYRWMEGMLSHSMVQNCLCSQPWGELGRILLIFWFLTSSTRLTMIRGAWTFR